MPLSALDKPATDPTPIFEAFRGSYGTELLTAAVAHFDLFGRLARQPLSTGELAAELHLAERPASVLATALRAMGLLNLADGRLHLSAVAREHLLPAAPFDVGDYIGLAAQSPGVLAMVERLRRIARRSRTGRAPRSSIGKASRRRWSRPSRPATSRWHWRAEPGTSLRISRSACR